MSFNIISVDPIQKINRVIIVFGRIGEISRVIDKSLFNSKGGWSGWNFSERKQTRIVGGAFASARRFFRSLYVR